MTYKRFFGIIQRYNAGFKPILLSKTVEKRSIF
jgi:hypothetical protein